MHVRRLKQSCLHGDMYDNRLRYADTGVNKEVNNAMLTNKYSIKVD